MRTAWLTVLALLLALSSAGTPGEAVFVAVAALALVLAARVVLTAGTAAAVAPPPVPRTPDLCEVRLADPDAPGRPRPRAPGPR